MDVLGALYERQRDPVDADLENVGEIGAILIGQRTDRKHGVGQADALAARQRAADEHFGSDAVLLFLDDAHAQLAVVEQQHVPWLDGREDLRVRKEHALGRARLLGALEAKDGAVVDEHAPAGEFPDAEFRPLQVGKDADRMAMALGYPTHGILQRARRLVRGVAHVDAEHVDARQEQALDHFRCGRGRAQGRDDLDPSLTSHFSLASGIGEADGPLLHSPVSTSKKPVRLKPRC